MHNTKKIVHLRSSLVSMPSVVFALGLVICTGDTESDIQEVKTGTEEKERRQKSMYVFEDFLDPTQRLI